MSKKNDTAAEQALKKKYEQLRLKKEKKEQEKAKAAAAAAAAAAAPAAGSAPKPAGGAALPPTTKAQGQAQAGKPPQTANERAKAVLGAPAGGGGGLPKPLGATKLKPKAAGAPLGPGTRKPGASKPGSKPGGGAAAAGPPGETPLERAKRIMAMEAAKKEKPKAPPPKLPGATPEEGAKAALTLGKGGPLPPAKQSSELKQPGISRHMKAAAAAAAAAAASRPKESGEEEPLAKRQRGEEGVATAGGRGHDDSNARQEGRVVFIGDLANHITKDMLGRTFSPYGDITNVKIHDGQSFGFVTFAEHHAAAHLVATLGHEGVEVAGKWLRVSWANGSMSEWKKTSMAEAPQDPYAVGGGAPRVGVEGEEDWGARMASTKEWARQKEEEAVRECAPARAPDAPPPPC